MASPSGHSHATSPILQVCANAIVQSQAQNHQLRLYAESQRREAVSEKQEADSLRSEVQQLRNMILYVERERDQELSKCDILQQLIDTQRRIIRDYEQERQSQISSNQLPGAHYSAHLHNAFTDIPVAQDDANDVGAVGGDAGDLGVRQMQ